MSQLYRKRLLATTLLVSATGVAMPALAQTNPNQTNQPASAPPAGAVDSATLPNPTDDTGSIIVTGSLIKNPNLRSAAPVQVVGKEEIQLRQSNTAEELIRDLPGVVPSLGSAVNNGTGGASFVNLRGLGQQRNLVLLDGDRIVPADVTGPVDLNNIPLALIERVDVLTGGAAVTYGADAVSGVVNFITRQDFSGIEINSGNQIDQRGDGREFRTDVTIGGNFDDGKGNAVLSVGYQQQDPVYQGDRKYSEFNVGSFSGANGGSSTEVPSRFAGFGLPGARQINTTTGALVAPYAPFNYNPYNLFLTPFRRYNIFGEAHYDVSDKVTFYTRGMFSKNTVQEILAPGGAFNATAVKVNYNNPYLPAAAAQQFCAANGLTTAQCTAAIGATGPTDPNYRTFTTNLARRVPEAGNRISTFTTTMFDYKAGVKYNFTDSLTLDVGGNYGQSENISKTQGQFRTSRVQAATLASSTTACDGAGALVDPSIGYNPSSDAGCVPLNIFGPEGSITADQLAYVTSITSVTQRSTLAQAHATLSGDVGVSSPYASNPISFALGVDYRKYTASQDADPISQISGEVSGAGAAAIVYSGAYDVQEAFGEVNAPLIDDKPFFKSLSIDGGARYSHYKVYAAGSPTFNTTTYMGKGTWEPVDGLTLRGNYQHAVRAPSIYELFNPVNTFLTNLSSDPCATKDQAGNSIAAPLTGALLATCTAQIHSANAASLVQGIYNDPGAQINGYGGGNLGLKPEKSNSYTLGVVLAPHHLLPNFSLSVDYFHIKITDAITAPTPGDSVNLCFSNPNPASAACQAIVRDPTTGDLFGNQSTTPGIPLGLSNQGRLFTDGIDLTANYRYDFGPARLNLNFSGTWTNRNQFKATPVSENRDCVGFYSTNCPAGSGSLEPEFYWNARATVSVKAVDFSVLWRHISHMRDEPLTIADTFVPASDGNPAQQSAACGGVNPDGSITDCGGKQFSKIPAYNYMDLSMRIGAGDHLEFTLTVQNALDKKPPIVGTGIGSTAFNSGNTYPSTYDALGRRFLMGAQLKF